MGMNIPALATRVRSAANARQGLSRGPSDSNEYANVMSSDIEVDTSMYDAANGKRPRVAGIGIHFTVYSDGCGVKLWFNVGNILSTTDDTYGKDCVLKFKSAMSFNMFMPL